MRNEKIAPAATSGRSPAGIVLLLDDIVIIGVIVEVDLVLEHRRSVADHFLPAKATLIDEKLKVITQQTANIELGDDGRGVVMGKNASACAVSGLLTTF